MCYVQKRNGRYRARYRDPLGRMTSATFDHKADAQRFLAEMETDKVRGTWIDPRHGEVPMAQWSQEFLALARRLSPSTQQTYRCDLTRYVLPALGACRLGSMPPDSVENWLNDDLEAGNAASSAHHHYRALRRVLQVAVDKQKLLTNPCDRVEPPRVPERKMVFLDWGQAVDLAEAHSDRYRALIYLGVDSGMRWSELNGLRRSKLDLGSRKVRVTEQPVRLETAEWVRKEPKAPLRCDRSPSRP
jgi:site-specific recombinase XerC